LKSINPEKFDYFHTLTDHVPEKDGDWDGLQGRIDALMLKECGFPE